MKSKFDSSYDYEQLDLLEDASMYQEAFPQEEVWDGSRGRDYIKAHGRNGKDITIVFDHLDQQYHLIDE